MDIISDEGSKPIEVRVKTMDSTEVRVKTQPKHTVKMLKDEIYKVSTIEKSWFKVCLFQIVNQNWAWEAKTNFPRKIA